MNDSAKSLRDILCEALEIEDSPRRAAYLAQACGTDTALRGKIEELIRADAEAGGFLPEKTADWSGWTVFLETAEKMVGGSCKAAWAEEKPGAQIGRYQLLQKIGEGGCGVVYLAEQEEPVRRKVALKIIKLGMDSRQVVARFNAERQALALMDHPNIAKVFDGGATNTGRPYFVMELVPGLKITDYCNRNRLPTSKRLELFIAVCHAVQHAHQKGIIHRDLKPSNVLVALNDPDVSGVPKVIDFGIAKATHGRLSDQTAFTAFEQFMGTPAYVSPEQATMTSLDVDTRGDIYSLGVLLYELLTGKTPFDTQALTSSGLDEMRRTIREKEPIRPSTRLRAMRGEELAAAARERAADPPKLINLIQGDLDWIVMKCLEKDRSRRYETANGLAMDVRRYLNNEAVTARPPSQLYLLSKLARRNRLAVAAAGAVSCALVAGAVLATWQYLEKSRAYARALAAERAAQHARSMEFEHRRKAETIAKRLSQTLSQLELEGAQEAFAAGSSAEGLALLAGVLRRDPSNELAAAQVLSALAQRSLPLPSTEALRHAGAVRSARFSADGQRVVTASRDGTARIWDALTGQPLTEPLRHKSRIEYAEFSPDGLRVVTASDDHTARLWEATTGRPLTAALSHGAAVNSARFSHDGRWVVTTADDFTARLWDAVTGMPLGPPLKHDAGVRYAEFSPNDRWVVTVCRDRAVRIWDVRTGALTVGPLMHHGFLRSAHFSPDGKQVLAVSWVTAQLWDADTGRPVLEALKHDAGVNSACFSADGRLIVTASDDYTARIWDTRTGKPVGQPLRHDDDVWDAEFSSDGSQVVTASRDRTARIWDAKTGQPLSGPVILGAASRAAQFSPDGTRIVAACGDQALVWLADAGRPWPKPLRHGGELTAARFSPDGRRVVTGAQDGTVRVWDATTGMSLTEPLPHGLAVSGTEFSPDGSRLLTVGGAMGRIWDSTTGYPLPRPLKHETEIVAASFRGDGQQIITGSGSTAQLWDATTGLPSGPTINLNSPILACRFYRNGQSVITVSLAAVQLWNPKTGGMLAEPLRFEQEVATAAFSLDGQWVVTTAADNSAWVWDLKTGLASAGPLRHQAPIQSAGFSPDGARVITASADCTARVWETRGGQPIAGTLKHGDWVLMAKFSPDGKRIVTASMDNTARIWDAQTGRPLSGRLRHDGSVCSAEFSPDGQRVITISRDKTARIWEVPAATVPVPDWLPLLAEAIARTRIGEEGLPEPVPLSELSAIRLQLFDRPESDVWTRWAKLFLQPEVSANDSSR